MNTPHWEPSCNPILRTDSYKASHFLQYPPGTRRLFGYLEARRGAQYPATLFFGLRYILNRYFDLFDCPISSADVENAAEFWAAHGEPFNTAGWMRVVDAHGGRLPLTIRAPLEGTLVPVGLPLITVESTDPELYWLATHIETALMRIWYPSTVATRSWFCKDTIMRHLRKSADDPEAEINFKLHDFGARGATSDESAGVGGMAHLVNFLGTDTVEGISMANLHYNTAGYDESLKDCPAQMYGFSIPAMEHSTVISWGSGGEVEAFRNMLRQHKPRGHKLIAAVSDSYDFFGAVENIWCGELLEEVKASGMKVVVRPDSGDPADVNTEALRIFARKLGPEMRVNSKGYVVLPSYYGLIQGDGNEDETSMDYVYDAVEGAGFSASNVGFGMGAGLLQKVNRDTQRMAYKISAVELPDTEGEERAVGTMYWRGVSKNPGTDRTKASKSGRITLVHRSGDEENDPYYSYAASGSPDDVMVTYFDDGGLTSAAEQDFGDIRKRAGEQKL